ncbi:hypothetical protein I4U23_024871 [Adineta vaga]|nr:hypothetical protein I4U23_024871 [Adineta vaga]
MLSIKQFVQKGLTSGFLKLPSINSNRIDPSSPSIFNYEPLTSNLFFNFRHEWIQSFIRNSSGRYQFLWVDSIDQIVNPTPSMTVAWQTKLTTNRSELPVILKREESTDNNDDDYLRVQYIEPTEEINLRRLADERTRFWKKYFSSREKVEFLSSKQNQFDINYRFSSDTEPYNLEMIQSNNSNSSLDLSLNINHTLISLLFDSQMKCLHPLLTPHQIGIKATLKTTELSLYISKLLTYKYRLRVVRVIDRDIDDYIPFHIKLDDNSLKTGVCSVWNRDTQLNEEVHVKLVAKRLADYFKALDDFV